MKVVIDIDEEIYNDIKEGFACSEYGDELIKSVEKGTPIHKECGRLVSADAIYGRIGKMIDSTPTIIEER